MKFFKCKNCNKEQSIKKNSTNTYCNNKCQKDYEYKTYIIAWKAGEIDGTKGSGRTLKPSNHIRKYIFNKFNYKCFKCSFDTPHPSDGSSILEIDHIDGNASNNKEDNLVLLCPNCHALTPTFRARNKGNGR